MSTIRSIIDRVNENKPNALSLSTMVAWVAELDGKIAIDIFLLDIVELPQFQYDPETDMDRELLVKFPHDDLYYYWLCAKIDAENGEYNKYQNTMQLYNASYDNFVQWFLTVYEPAHGVCCRRKNATHYISAYGLAVKQGFTGSLDEWLVSLIGSKGDRGADGRSVFYSPSVTQSGESWTTSISAAFPDGQEVAVGDMIITASADVYQIEELVGDGVFYSKFCLNLNGNDGAAGADGKSAYEYAKDGGYTGTEQEFSEQMAKGGNGLPAVTEEDNGKFMGVVGGKWTAVELPVYAGEFVVTPSATEDQTLATAQTYLDADIKIEKIPYSEVLNNSGGTTVNIGG